MVAPRVVGTTAVGACMAAAYVTAAACVAASVRRQERHGQAAVRTVAAHMLEACTAPVAVVQGAQQLRRAAWVLAPHQQHRNNQQRRQRHKVDGAAGLAARALVAAHHRHRRHRGPPAPNQRSGSWWRRLAAWGMQRRRAPCWAPAATQCGAPRATHTGSRRARHRQAAAALVQPLLPSHTRCLTQWLRLPSHGGWGGVGCG